MFKPFLYSAVILSLAGCASVDQALYSVSNSVSSVDRVTGKRTLNLTDRSAQIAQSDAEIEQAISQSTSPINEKVDAKAYARLRRVFNKVHSVSHLKDEQWKVLLLPEESFNAFVNGGTYVMVHKGLMDQIKSDDELAVVLGHEIAHVAANHRYKKAAHQLIATLKGSKSAQRDSFQAAFTHENEEQADQIGVLYATLAGYDPYAGSRLWGRMYENEGDFSLMVVDHPINSERQKYNQELADIYKQYYKPGKINPDHEMILATNEVFGSPPEDMSAPSSGAVQPGEGGGFLALLETVAEGLETHYAAQAEEARQQSHVMKIEWVTKAIEYTDIKPWGSNEVLVSAKYNGYETLNNLTFMAQINDEQATRRIEYPVNPNDYFEFEMKFNNDISQSYQNIGIMVSHVD